MDEFMGLILVAVVLGVFTGIIGKRIAMHKGRSQSEGFWLGFLLSIVGLIIEGVLPAITRSNPVRLSSEIESRLFDGVAGEERPRRKCPFCAEMILAEASVCRYCQRDVPSAEVVQAPSSNVLCLNESGTAYHRQDCSRISAKSLRPVELSEIPQGVDPCPICNPPAAYAHEAVAQAPANEERSPAEEHSFPFAASSNELNSKRDEQVTHAADQAESMAQAPTQATCPSCGRMVSARDASCFFCGKKLRV